MPLLRDLETGTTVRFFRSLRVGRAPDNDLVLSDRTVSSFHACVQLRRGAWFLKDLGSSNGTTLDGAAVHGWTRLEAGGAIGFGAQARWTLDELASAADAGGASPWVVVGDERTRITHDRLTVGRGASWDVSLSVGPPGLHAVLFVEDDAMYLMGVGDADVSLDGAELPLDSPVPLSPGQSFVVSGQQLTLSLDQPTLSGFVATAQTGVPARAYAGVHLALEDRGDFGDIVVSQAGEEHRFPDQELRFALLLVLAQELLRQADQGLTENVGWMNDEDLRIGIWGRRAIENQATSTLAKLMHDTRAMLGRKGIDGLFLEKKRGRSRLRLDPAAVCLR